MKKIMMIGYGAMAKEVIARLPEGVEVGWILARAAHHAAIAEAFGGRVQALAHPGQCSQQPDLVLECASQQAVAEFGEAVLQRGWPLALISTGALADAALQQRLQQVCRRHHGQLIVLQARATMLWLLGTPLGAALGFPVTLYILNTFDWQTTFFFMAFLTLPVMLLVLFGMRHLNVSRPAAAAKPAVSERKQHRRELLRSPHFWMICLFNIAFLTYLWGMNGWLPSYLIKGKGIHLEHAGYLSSLPFIAMLLGEVLGAWLSDKLDRRALACFLSLCGAGLGLAVVLHLQGTYSVIAAMAFSTFMWGAGAPNIFALLAKATSSKVSATAGGIFNGLGNFAGALAPVLMGALIAATGNMDNGLLFLVVMAFVGCLILLPLLRKY